MEYPNAIRCNGIETHIHFSFARVIEVEDRMRNNPSHVAITRYAIVWRKARRTLHLIIFFMAVKFVLNAAFMGQVCRTSGTSNAYLISFRLLRA